MAIMTEQGSDLVEHSSSLRKTDQRRRKCSGEKIKWLRWQTVTEKAWGGGVSCQVTAESQRPGTSVPRQGLGERAFQAEGSRTEAGAEAGAFGAGQHTGWRTTGMESHGTMSRGEETEGP